MVFTGKLSSLGRKEARALVERLGGASSDDVSAATTLLVVGAEGFGPERGQSHKQRRAEELNATGQAAIEVVTENAFCRLAGVPTAESLRRQYHALRDLLTR